MDRQKEKKAHTNNTKTIINSYRGKILKNRNGHDTSTNDQKGIYPLKGKLKENSPIITDKIENTAKRNLQ